MPIAMTCPQCQKGLTVADKLAGKKIKCPACKNVLDVPGGAPAEEDELTLSGPSHSSPAPQTQPAAPAASRPVEADDDLQIAGSSHDAAPKETKRCLNCDNEMDAEFQFCVRCGYDFKTGKTRGGGKIGTYTSGITPTQIIKTVVAIAIIIGGAYGGWYAYKGLTAEEKQETNTKGGQTPAPAKTDSATTPKPTEDVAPKPAAPLKKALVVFKNSRFPSIRIFGEGEKVADVAYGEKFVQTIDIEKPYNYTFELRDLDRNVQPNYRTKADLEKGTAINCKSGEGTEVNFEGPPADLVPAPKAVVNPASARKEPSGVIAIVTELKYKDATLRGDPLKLAVNGDQYLWILQDCTVEKDGKAVYSVPEKPFTIKTLTLVNKDGKPEVKE